MLLLVLHELAYGLVKPALASWQLRMNEASAQCCPLMTVSTVYCIGRQYVEYPEYRSAPRGSRVDARILLDRRVARRAGQRLGSELFCLI